MTATVIILLAIGFVCGVLGSYCIFLSTGFFSFQPNRETDPFNYYLLQSSRALALVGILSLVGAVVIQSIAKNNVEQVMVKE